MKKNDIASLLTELGDEVSRENEAELSPSEVALSEIAKQLLQLERDLSVPGVNRSDSERQQRIMDWIEERDF